jgi:XTP/dITP diphosphohydrolase
LADDSGLEVDALNQAPGIYSARYGGPGLTPEQRYNYLLGQMVDVPLAERSARFRCVIAIAGAGGEPLASAAGVCEGVIANAPSGSGGFGYDPIFLLPDRGRTMAQLSAKEKHIISHRGRALKAIEPALTKILTMIE